jgi:hypothetical protein
MAGFMPGIHGFFRGRLRKQDLDRPNKSYAELYQRHCEERNRRSNPFFTRRDGLLRGACHRARIRATRWLAMTEDFPGDKLGCEFAVRAMRTTTDNRAHGRYINPARQNVRAFGVGWN